MTVYGLIYFIYSVSRQVQWSREGLEAGEDILHYCISLQVRWSRKVWEAGRKFYSIASYKLTAEKFLPAPYPWRGRGRIEDPFVEKEKWVNIQG